MVDMTHQSTGSFVILIPSLQMIFTIPLLQYVLILLFQLYFSLVTVVSRVTLFQFDDRFNILLTLELHLAMTDGIICTSDYAYCVFPFINLSIFQTDETEFLDLTIIEDFI